MANIDFLFNGSESIQPEGNISIQYGTGIKKSISICNAGVDQLKSHCSSI